ncbi:hypothetical protein QNI19_31915 [Cytophagaceae bacterium DM2B3-1]|uniref:DUF3806 domain-containing protein n=1 Tax=Xanthocytophaga flava TaxID=3048013 RepID=A0ABT7CYB9_9BACT|nr:hypothetical protein [Xanthocytophaga flavus]MDJ1497589.1 hypothetical protein [Xanthocytophaga flavus]
MKSKKNIVINDAKKTRITEATIEASQTEKRDEKDPKESGERDELRAYIGEKLRELRLDLAERTDSKWTQKRLNDTIGLLDGMIERMENGRGGFISNFIMVFEFFYAQGYNLNWLIVRDNKGIPKYRAYEGNVNIESYLTKLEDYRNKMTVWHNQELDQMMLDIILQSSQEGKDETTNQG